MDADTFVVGAHLDDDNGEDSGAVYVYRDSAGTGDWVSVAKLTAANGREEAQFGRSVAIESDAVVVGALDDDEEGTSAGAVYIFERDLGAMSLGVGGKTDRRRPRIICWIRMGRCDPRGSYCGWSSHR